MYAFAQFRVFAILGLLFSPALAFADDQYTQVLEYQPQAALGVGWNTLTNQVSDARATCLDPKSYKPQENTNGRYSGNFRLVSSRSDIEDGLGLNVSAGYRGLVYKASGSVKFAQDQTVSASSTQVAGFATAETRVESVLGKTGNEAANAAFISSDAILSLNDIQQRFGGLSLDRHKLKLLTSKNPDDVQKFFRECGDGFVSDIYHGGRLNIVASLSSNSEKSKQTVESTLKGEGGGFNIGIDSLVSAAKSKDVTNFSSNYLIVGTDGSGGSFTDIDGLKQKFNEFNNKAYQHDAGIRLRITSYALLLPNSGQYRFGVAKDAIEAARLVNELTSVWQTLGQMLDDQHAFPVRWDRSVGQQCIKSKQDEIIRNNQSIVAGLKTCAQDTVSAMSTAASCSKAKILAQVSVNSENSTACPATTTLVNNRVSEFDYRLFYPALGKSDSCAPPKSSEVREKVRQEWIKPRWDAICNHNPNQNPQLCLNSTLDALVQHIHVPDRGLPPLPTGGYKRSCQVKTCTTKWGDNDRGLIRCTCSSGGKSKPTKWTSMQCPQKIALQNCHGVLKYTKSCG